MALDHVDLQSVVSPKDSVINKDLPPIYGDPEGLAAQFFWDKETVMSDEKLDQQLDQFLKEHPELGLDKQRVLDSLKAANDAAEKDFNLLYGNQENKPDYHNAEHVKLTATEGLKIFLGGMVELYKDPKFKAMIDADPNKMQQLVDIAVNTMAYHELDDWWSRRSEETIKNIPNDPEWDKNQQTVRDGTKALCQKLGITPEDFNRMNVIDTFFIPLESDQTKDPPIVGTLDRAMEDVALKNPYFKDTDNKPDFAFLGQDKEVQRKFLKLLGESTRSADFLQLYNSHYYREARIVGEGMPPDGLASNIGSIALAKEFHEFRPNAAKPIGWIKEDGSINWENVGVGKDYLTRFALPNIRLGVAYLTTFNLQEGTNVDLITTDLEKAVGIKS